MPRCNVAPGNQVSLTLMESCTATRVNLILCRAAQVWVIGEGLPVGLYRGEVVCMYVVIIIIIIVIVVVIIIIVIVIIISSPLGVSLLVYKSGFFPPRGFTSISN